MSRRTWRLLDHCADCRTVAVAGQAVLVTGDPSTVTPKNAALAVNDNCLRCQTFADAHEYVVSTGGPAQLSAEGQHRVADIRQRLAATAASQLPFDQLEAEVDTLYAEFKGVIDDDLVRNRGTPRPEHLGEIWCPAAIAAGPASSGTRGPII